MKTHMKQALLPALLFAGMLFGSCAKKQSSTSCYDRDLEAQHKNDICLTDCPGVTGCDGNFYCNECVMHSKGIAKAK